MDTPTIIKLRELRDNLRKSIRSIKIADYSGQNFGPENEYTAKGIVAGLEAITTDLSALIKAPAKFIQISTHDERNKLVQLFTNIQNHVNAKNIAQLATFTDQVKPILRGYGIRHGDERKDEFIKCIDDLQKESTSLASQIDDIQGIKKSADELHSEIISSHEELTGKLNELNKSTNELDNLLSNTEANRIKLEGLLEIDQKRTQEIESLLTDSKSHKELIDNFSKKISQRESQLEDQETKTIGYNEALTDYKKQHEDYLEEAKALIENAKLALEYKTAEGLSAAFIEKYNETKIDKSTTNWIIASGFFLVSAVAIGIWIVWEKQVAIETILGRVSLLPMLIAGAWFSASQYIKQKNIAEDYAYKSVLAKSMVGFSDQLSSGLNKGEEYSHYIKSVLSEIHNDPLRKHSETPTNNEVDLKELLKEVKGFQVLSKKLDKLLSNNKGT